MRRKFWGVFGILTIVLTGLATGLFFVVHQSDNGEPNTNLTATSSTSIYTKEQYFDTIARYEDFEYFVGLQNGKHGKEYAYDHFAIMPCLEATRTRNFKTNKIEMCTTMVPQGVTIAEDYLLTTAYDKTRDHNSVVYVQDVKTHKLLKTILLHGRSHVGGITYDPINQEVWVTAYREEQAAAFAFPIQSITKYDEHKAAKIKYEQKALFGEMSHASYITYHKKSLYVGLFTKKRGGYIQRFKIDSDGGIDGEDNGDSTYDVWSAYAEPVKSLTALKQVQGLAFYKGYAILSQSFGKGSSKIYLFEEKSGEWKYDAVATFKAPSHLEQISMYNGRLYMCFESGAYEYRHRSKDYIDRIISMNVQDLVTYLKKEK